LEGSDNRGELRIKGAGTRRQLHRATRRGRAGLSTEGIPGSAEPTARLVFQRHSIAGGRGASMMGTNVRVRRGDAAGSSHPRPELRLVVKNDVAPRDEPWTLKLDPAITHKPGVARSRRHVRTEQNMGSDHEAISSVIGSTEAARNALARCIVPPKRWGIPPLRRRPLMN